jgi:nitrite reductase/ring-hydroxylating ferredoxin subunit
MREISRRLFISSVLSGVFSLIGVPAFANSLPLQKPKKIGERTIWKGKNYIAVKSRSGLIWQFQSTPKVTKSDSPSPQPVPQPKTQSIEVFISDSSDLALGQTKLYSPADGRANGLNFILTRTIGGVVAFNNICTHLQESVAVESSRLYCQSHGSVFNRNTGAVENGPASFPLRSYTVVEKSGKILVVL